MRIVSLVNPLSGCDYHRIKLPLLHLHRRKLIEGVPAGNTFEEDLAQCDMLMYNRMPFGTSLDELIRLRTKYGFKICVDIDDYWHLYPGHYFEKAWIEQDVPRQIVNNIIAADVVTCTNDRLKDYIAQYNSNVYVTPNALPFDDEQFSIPSIFECVRDGFIYAGGGSHQWDVNLLRSSIKKLADEKFTGKITLAGVTDAAPYVKMSNVLSGNGRILNFQKLPSESLESYMSLYDHGEVSLAPLVDNKFNACKSNLKILEAGAKGMPIIVSNVGPYLDDECPYIMRADKPMDFYKWLKYCNDNKNREHLNDHAQSLSEYVRHNYDVRNMNYLRLEAFSSVVAI